MPWRSLRVPVGQAAWAGAGQKKEGRKKKRKGIKANKGPVLQSFGEDPGSGAGANKGY